MNKIGIAGSLVANFYLVNLVNPVQYCSTAYLLLISCIPFSFAS